MEATRHSYKDIVKSLLEKKANPNITEKVGLSALAINIHHYYSMDHLTFLLIVSARVWLKYV